MSLVDGFDFFRLISSVRSSRFKRAFDSAASLAKSALLWVSVPLMMFRKNLVFGLGILAGLFGVREDALPRICEGPVLLGVGVLP